MRWPWQKERDKVKQAEQVVREEQHAEQQHQEHVRLQQREIEQRLAFVRAQVAVQRRRP